MTSKRLWSKLILVVGLPRSGTTWLGKIFDSHPDTFYSHEPDSARPFRDVPLLVPRESESEYKKSLRSEVEELARVRSPRVVGKLPVFGKRDRRTLPPWLRSTGLMALKSFGRFWGDVDVPLFLAGSVERSQAWVWKSIESSGRLGAVARAFPESRAVLIVRHPCAVVASVLRGEAHHRFSAGASSEDYGIFELLAATKQARAKKLDMERFHRMSSIERLAWRWALLNEFALNSIDGLSNCQLVRYEDLCVDPQGIAKRILSFAGLAWNPQTEDFVRLSTSGEEGGYYSVFKNPTVAAEAWRKELEPSVVETILSTVSETVPGRLYAEQPAG